MGDLSYFLFGVLGAALLAAPLFYVQKKRQKSILDDTKKLDQQVVQLQEVLAGMPDGLYRWNVVNGVENCSGRMAVLLDLVKGAKSNYFDILDCFDEDAARSLDGLVNALHTEGQSFDLVLPLKGDDNRVIQAVGQRVLSGDGQPLVDLLWMRLANESIIANGPLQKKLQIVTNERDKLIRVMENLPVPIWVRDRSTEIIFQNPLAPANDQTLPLAERAFESGRAIKERMNLTIDQYARPFEISEIPLPQGEGSIGLAQDISQSEVRIREARKNGAILSAALENLVTAIAIFSGDMRLSFFNSAYARMWGFSNEWLSTQPSLGEILDRLREMRKLPEVANFKIFKQDQMDQFTELDRPKESTLHLPDNSILRHIVSPHPDGGLVMTFEDVSDTIALESSNKAMSAVQRETLDNLFEAVVVFGPDGRVKLFNPAFANLWNLPVEFLNTHPHITRVMEETRSFYEGIEDWTKFRDTRVAQIMKREQYTQRLIRSDGRIMEFASVPLPDGGSLLSYLDVTDSAHVEQALRERSDAQHEADLLKSEFIANVSYEIRTPLTTVLGFADLLREEYFGQLNKRQMEYAQGIHESAEKLNKLVSDILDLANIESAQQGLELEHVDIQVLLMSVMGLVKESAKRQRLFLEYECPQDIGWITIDEKRIKQVLFNLLNNAMRHTPAGGTIMIKAKKQESFLNLTVSDTGSGMSEQEQLRVFNSFERGDKPETNRGGSGLGLTLVQKFVELHGGDVQLSSELNKGTDITCRLPL